MITLDFKLDPTRLQIPTNLHAENLRIAGLAWLDMAIKLLAIEAYSVLRLDWSRSVTGGEPSITIALDSSKNWLTKPLRRRSGAPQIPDDLKRKKMLVAAVGELLKLTTVDDLWEALIGSPLQDIHCRDIQTAWEVKDTDYALEHPERYPAFHDGHEYLDYRMKAATPGICHPWM